MSHVTRYLSNKKDTIDAIFQIIKNSQIFLLLGHKSPDWDCIGSLLGFGKRLENQWKEVYYFTPSKAQWFDRVDGIENIRTRDRQENFSFPDCEVIISLDFSSPNRWEDKQIDLEILSKTKKFICIDHHVSPEWLTQNDVIDTNSSSCCELLWELMSYRSSEHLDQYIANSCYLWLVTDTSELFPRGFEFIRDSLRIFENASSIAHYNPNINYILQNLNKTSFNQIQFMQLCLKRLTKYKRILWTWYTSEEYEQWWLDKAQTGLAIQIARTIEDYDVFIEFSKDSKGRKCSMRSKNNRDVWQVARQFGGGGHKAAAGCEFANTKRKVKDLEKIVQEIDKLIV